MFSNLFIYNLGKKEEQKDQDLAEWVNPDFSDLFDGGILIVKVKLL